VEARRHDGGFAHEGASPRSPISRGGGGIGTLLITGGAGFIGSNFVRHALAHTAHALVIVDKLTYAGNRINLEDVLANPRVVFVHADIADRPAMEQVFAAHRPTAVVNLAAETHVDRSIDSPQPFIHSNVVGVAVLLDVARRRCAALDDVERNDFRFLHVSTDEVFGSLGPKGAFSEDSPYAPSSPYAASKAAGDHLVRAFGHTYGLPILVTNCSNNYGRYQFPEKLIQLLILNALDQRPLPIYGDGGQVRDWLHVADHCAGITTVLQHGHPGESYNIGGHNERTNVAVVDAICDLLDEIRPMKSTGESYRALKSFVPDRPGHDRRYAIDAGKIQRELGWRAQHSFADGLRDTVQWYLAHLEWCEQVQSGRYDRERLGLGQ
jgi:dTDP-glucose 4,6-dehydratase